jgi:hypothetical protein
VGKQFDELSEAHIEFIGKQKLFFVGTAAADGKVNVSPKGLDSLRVLGPRRVIWLNLTGSGNETAAHVLLNPRMTLMFSAFEGPPVILRLYGTAAVYHSGDPQWSDLFRHFDPIPGARQIFDLAIVMVQISCGMAVTYYDYAGDRSELVTWADKQGEDGLHDYWSRKNQASLDGFTTDILARSKPVG